MSFIIKSIFKSSSSLDSIVKDAVDKHTLTKKDNQPDKPLNDQIKALATQVLQDHYGKTCFKGLREKAIKSSIKQYLREERTKAIAHLLNEVRDGFKTRLPNNITNEAIKDFAEKIKDKKIPESEKTYGQLLTSEKIEHIVKNWHKIALILAHNKIIQVNKQANTVEGRMDVTQKSKPIQKVAKYLNKKIDGELIERKPSLGRIPDNKDLQKLDKAEFAKNKKIEFAMDKAFVSTFRDEFHFSPIERELLYNAINKKIIADRAKTGMKCEDNVWARAPGGGITSDLIRTSLQPRDDAYGRPINYDMVKVPANNETKASNEIETEESNEKKENTKEIKVIKEKEQKLFDDFAKKFDEPSFVENVRFLCHIKKANPELVEEAGLHDFRLFELINKFAPPA